MSDWKRCPKCGVYDFFGTSTVLPSHKCKPAFEARYYYDKDPDSEEWELIYSDDAESAACDFAARTGGSDFDHANIQIRAMGSDQSEVYRVDCEMVPKYSVRQLVERAA